MTRFLQFSAFSTACYAVILGGLWAYSGQSPLPELVQRFAGMVLAIRAGMGG